MMDCVGVLPSVGSINEGRIHQEGLGVSGGSVVTSGTSISDAIDFDHLVKDIMDMPADMPSAINLPHQIGLGLSGQLSQHLLPNLFGSSFLGMPFNVQAPMGFVPAAAEGDTFENQQQQQQQQFHQQQQQNVVMSQSLHMNHNNNFNQAFNDNNMYAIHQNNNNINSQIPRLPFQYNNSVPNWGSNSVQQLGLLNHNMSLQFPMGLPIPSMVPIQAPNGMKMKTGRKPGRPPGPSDMKNDGLIKSYTVGSTSESAGNTVGAHDQQEVPVGTGLAQSESSSISTSPSIAQTQSLVPSSTDTQILPINVTVTSDLLKKPRKSRGRPFKPKVVPSATTTQTESVQEPLYATAASTAEVVSLPSSNVQVVVGDDFIMSTPTATAATESQQNSGASVAVPILTTTEMSAQNSSGFSGSTFTQNQTSGLITAPIVTATKIPVQKWNGILGVTIGSSTQQVGGLVGADISDSATSMYSQAVNGFIGAQIAAAATAKASNSRKKAKNIEGAKVKNAPKKKWKPPISLTGAVTNAATIMSTQDAHGIAGVQNSMVAAANSQQQASGLATAQNVTPTAENANTVTGSSMIIAAMNNQQEWNGMTCAPIATAPTNSQQGANDLPGAKVKTAPPRKFKATSRSTAMPMQNANGFACAPHLTVISNSQQLANCLDGAKAPKAAPKKKVKSANSLHNVPVITPNTTLSGSNGIYEASTISHAAKSCPEVNGLVRSMAFTNDTKSGLPANACLTTSDQQSNNTLSGFVATFTTTEGQQAKDTISSGATTTSPTTTARQAHAGFKFSTTDRDSLKNSKIPIPVKKPRRRKATLNLSPNFDIPDNVQNSQMTLDIPQQIQSRLNKVDQFMASYPQTQMPQGSGYAASNAGDFFPMKMSLQTQRLHTPPAMTSNNSQNGYVASNAVNVDKTENNYIASNVVALSSFNLPAVNLSTPSPHLPATMIASNTQSNYPASNAVDSFSNNTPSVNSYTQRTCSPSSIVYSNNNNTYAPRNGVEANRGTMSLKRQRTQSPPSMIQNHIHNSDVSKDGYGDNIGPISFKRQRTHSPPTMIQNHIQNSGFSKNGFRDNSGHISLNRQRTQSPPTMMIHSDIQNISISKNAFGDDLPRLSSIDSGIFLNDEEYKNSPPQSIQRDPNRPSVSPTVTQYTSNISQASGRSNLHMQQKPKTVSSFTSGTIKGSATDGTDIFDINVFIDEEMVGRFETNDAFKGNLGISGIVDAQYRAEILSPKTFINSPSSGVHYDPEAKYLNQFASENSVIWQEINSLRRKLGMQEFVAHSTLVECDNHLHYNMRSLSPDSIAVSAYYEEAVRSTQNLLYNSKSKALKRKHDTEAHSKKARKTAASTSASSLAHMHDIGHSSLIKTENISGEISQVPTFTDYTSAVSMPSKVKPVSGKHRPNFSANVVAMLAEWFEENKNDPYPTQAVKEAFAIKTGLTLKQVNDWFINARRRKIQ
ncbi:hypothetical protein HDV05_004859 [Chytridiales sp. JEL 0842]|nr:hypothetical protein HDV05_004859 [Chytridiales sp. JEL 0842]